MSNPPTPGEPVPDNKVSIRDDEKEFTKTLSPEAEEAAYQRLLALGDKAEPPVEQDPARLRFLRAFTKPDSGSDKGKPPSK